MTTASLGHFTWVESNYWRYSPLTDAIKQVKWNYSTFKLYCRVWEKRKVEG